MHSGSWSWDYPIGQTGFCSKAFLTPRLTGRLPLLDLHRQLAPSSLQGLLAYQHYSPWNTPSGTAERLLPLLRRLLHSVSHDPCIPELPAITLTTLAHGLPGVVIPSDSDPPEVPVPSLPLPLSVSRPTGLSPDPTVPSTISAGLSSALALIPPSTSLLFRPGRALTLADFPEPSPASASSDDSSATPYHPRFVPAVRAPPRPPCELSIAAGNSALRGCPEAHQSRMVYRLTRPSARNSASAWLPTLALHRRRVLLCPYRSSGHVQPRARHGTNVLETCRRLSPVCLEAQ